MDAVIICDTDGSAPIAGVPLLDRQIVALHRGGCEKVTVVGGRWLSGTPRSDAHGYSYGHELMLAPTTEPMLVLASDVLVEARDVVRIIESGSRLESAEGVPLNAGIVPAGPLEGFREELDNQPIIRAQGVAMQIRDKEDRWWAAQELWASLGSSTDGAVDTWFNRPVGRLLSKLLVHNNITPNQVSVFATLIGILSGTCFAIGSYWAAVIGAILLQISTIIDCVDGDLARIAFKESTVGKWLDIVGDQVVHIAVFVGIGVGLWQVGVEAPVRLLATSAAVGVVISFGVVLRGMLLPKTDENALLHMLIDKMTNRDFSVVLLVLAIAGQLSLFLWLVGIGVHVFWISALGAQLIGKRAK
jgi:phosphatidylglycerophosphate synthase